MKTTVSLEGLEFFAYHGVYEKEQKNGNTFMCDVSAELKSFDSDDDNIDDTVNYEDIYQIICEEMKIPRKLMETVAYSIIKRIQVLDNVTAATVRMHKIRPPIEGKIQRAVVEMSF